MTPDLMPSLSTYRCGHRNSEKELPEGREALLLDSQGSVEKPGDVTSGVRTLTLT